MLHHLKCGDSIVPPMIITISWEIFMSGSKPRLPPGDDSNMNPKSNVKKNENILVLPNDTVNTVKSGSILDHNTRFLKAWANRVFSQCCLFDRASDRIIIFWIVIMERKHL